MSLTITNSINTMIYFHKVTRNTIVCTSEPFGATKGELNGVEASTRNVGEVIFGLLCIVDDDGSTKVLNHRGSNKDGFDYKLEDQQELPGYKMSDQPVLDKVTKEPTGMFWVTAV